MQKSIRTEQMHIALARFLHEGKELAEYSVSELFGGQKDNAIPRECLSEIIVEADKAEAVKAAVEETVNEIREEFATSDADFNVTTELSDGCSVKAVTKEDSAKAVALIQSLPNGIMRMSQDIDNLVETSLNLGIISLDESGICLRFALRSSVGAALKNLKNQIACVSKTYGGSVEFTGEYPAWEYKKDSNSVMIWLIYLNRCMVKNLLLRQFMQASNVVYLQERLKTLTAYLWDRIFLIFIQRKSI